MTPENGSVARKVSFKQVLFDVILNVGRSSLVGIYCLFSIIITMILFFCDYEQICQVYNISKTILTVFPEILGFSIAGYAIILGLQIPQLISRLNNTANDGKKPFVAICATFSSNLLFQILTMSAALAYQLLCNKFLYYSMLALAITSFLLLVSLVFHLFSICTFYCNINTTHRSEDQKQVTIYTTLADNNKVQIDHKDSKDNNNTNNKHYNNEED